MTRTTIIALTASFAGFAVLPAPVRADTLTIRPLQAATLEIGSDHAVSYFTHDNGRCNLVVTRAGQPNEDKSSFEMIRFESSIPAGQSDRYDGSVEFTCASDAHSMLVRYHLQVAGH